MPAEAKKKTGSSKKPLADSKSPPKEPKKDSKASTKDSKAASAKKSDKPKNATSASPEKTKKKDSSKSPEKKEKKEKKTKTKDDKEEKKEKKKSKSASKSKTRDKSKSKSKGKDEKKAKKDKKKSASKKSEDGKKKKKDDTAKKEAPTAEEEKSDPKRLERMQQAMVMNLLSKQLNDKDREMLNLQHRLNNLDQQLHEHDEQIKKGKQDDNLFPEARKVLNSHMRGESINILNQKQTSQQATPRASDRNRPVEYASQKGSKPASIVGSQQFAKKEMRFQEPALDMSQKISEQEEDTQSMDVKMFKKDKKSKKKPQFEEESFSSQYSGSEINGQAQKKKKKPQQEEEASQFSVSKSASHMETEDAGDDVEHLKRQVTHLQSLNAELKKKVIKYKKQIEIIPELKAELQKMKSLVDQAHSELMSGGMPRHTFHTVQYQSDPNNDLIAAALNPAHLQTMHLDMPSLPRGSISQQSASRPQGGSSTDMTSGLRPNQQQQQFLQRGGHQQPFPQEGAPGFDEGSSQLPAKKHSSQVPQAPQFAQGYTQVQQFLQQQQLQPGAQQMNYPQQIQNSNKPQIQYQQQFESGHPQQPIHSIPQSSQQQFLQQQQPNNSFQPGQPIMNGQPNQPQMMVQGFQQVPPTQQQQQLQQSFADQNKGAYPPQQDGGRTPQNRLPFQAEGGNGSIPALSQQLLNDAQQMAQGFQPQIAGQQQHPNQNPQMVNQQQLDQPSRNQGAFPDQRAFQSLPLQQQQQSYNDGRSQQPTHFSTYQSQQQQPGSAQPQHGVQPSFQEGFQEGIANNQINMDFRGQPTMGGSQQAPTPKGNANMGQNFEYQQNRGPHMQIQGAPANMPQLQLQQMQSMNGGPQSSREAMNNGQQIQIMNQSQQISQLNNSQRNGGAPLGSQRQGTMQIGEQSSFHMQLKPTSNPQYSATPTQGGTPHGQNFPQNMGGFQQHNIGGQSVAPTNQIQGGGNTMFAPNPTIGYSASNGGIAQNQSFSGGAPMNVGGNAQNQVYAQNQVNTQYPYTPTQAATPNGPGQNMVSLSQNNYGGQAPVPQLQGGNNMMSVSGPSQGYPANTGHNQNANFSAAGPMNNGGAQFQGQTSNYMNPQGSTPTSAFNGNQSQIPNLGMQNQRSTSPIDYTFGLKTPIPDKGPSLEQLRKTLDIKDEKTFAFVKENVELKGLISELKEQLIKRSHIIENLNSEIKIMLNDMRYMHQKLNRGQGIGNVSDGEITSKFLVSQIDNLIDEKLFSNKDSNERNQLLEERVSGLKEQLHNLQSIIDKNQEIIVQQSSKLSSYEDLNKNLRSDLASRADSEKLLEAFKQGVRNHLLNIKHQLEAISAPDYSHSTPAKRQSLDRLHELTVDQLIDQVADRAQSSCHAEKNLRQLVEQLQEELQQKAREYAARTMDAEERRQFVAREAEEHRHKLQEHINRLEGSLEKQKYDKSFNQIDAEARLKAKDMQVSQVKEDTEVLESFLVEAFQRLKVLNFEKRYLEVEARSTKESLDSIESELRKFLPSRDLKRRKRPIEKLRKSVTAVIFALRIRKASQYQGGEQYLRKKALGRLLDNWMNHRQYWDTSIKQSPRLFGFVDSLFQRMQKRPIRLAELPLRHISEDKLEYIDALKVKIRDLESQIGGYSSKMGELRNQVEFQNRRISTFEQDQRMRSLSGERSPIRTQRAHAGGNQDELVIRLRGVVRDMESRIEEQTVTYEQKIRYLKQEIEMKRLQIENMKRLVEFRDNASSGHDRQYSTTQPSIQTMLPQEKTRNHHNSSGFKPSASLRAPIHNGALTYSDKGSYGRQL